MCLAGQKNPVYDKAVELVNEGGIEHVSPKGAISQVYAKPAFFSVQQQRSHLSIIFAKLSSAKFVLGSRFFITCP